MKVVICASRSEVYSDDFNDFEVYNFGLIVWYHWFKLK